MSATGGFAGGGRPAAPRGPRVVLEPAQYLVLAYGAIVLAGALLLKLPQASAGRPLSWIDAVFTATSAASVTGLTVVDTALEMTRFGQVVILALVEVGALGIMTVSTFFLLLLGRRIRLRDRIILQQDLNQSLFSGLIRLVRRVVALSFLIQLGGAAVLYVALRPRFGTAGEALFAALFHAVSAFGNAGFDIFGEGLAELAGDAVVTGTLAALVILGGLGFSVLEELLAYPRTRSFSLLARVALAMTLALTLFGALLFLLLEWGNPRSLGAFGWFERVWHAVFFAAAARTGGFAAVPVGGLVETSLVIFAALMIIGGAPGSTAGGIKTTTAAVILAGVRASLAGRRDVNLFDRRLPPDAVSRALAVATMFGAILFAGLLGLTVTERAPFLPLFFEAASAMSTAGLSTGLTPQLSDAGKAILIVLMLAGRIGPVTLALAIGGREHRPEPFRLPEERLPLG